MRSRLLAVWRSLRFRLLLAIGLTCLLTNLIGVAVWIASSPYISYAEIATLTTGKLVAQSIMTSKSGARIEPTSMLQTYTRRRAHLKYAATLDGDVLGGSAPELVPTLTQFNGYVGPMSELIFQRKNEHTRIYLTPYNHGRLVVISQGDRFYFDDIKTLFDLYTSELFPIFAGMIISLLLIVPVIIQVTLASLVGASRQASALNMKSLDNRIEERALPTEIVPFVRAINQALGGLADSVARWRVFTANAAHELRTPVAILEAQIDDLPRSEAQLGLKRSARRLGLLVDQMLAVSRMTQQQVDVSETVDVIDCLRSVAADFAPLALRANLAIALEAEVGSLFMIGNRRALESAIGNLVDNALDAEPPGGTILLQASSQAGAAIISVVDHGPGVPVSDRKLVFEPFWRRSVKRRGGGLGLANVAQVGALHGGSVSVSETPSGGATFTLRLPTISSQPVFSARQPDASFVG